MADTVTSLLLENGPRNFGYSFTNLSDGTGESGVVKVDGSATGPLGVVQQGQTIYPTVHIKIRSVIYSVVNMALRIRWDASSPLDALILNGFGNLDFGTEGAIFIPVGTTGATGKILFTTVAAANNSSYSVVMRGLKGI